MGETLLIDLRSDTVTKPSPDMRKAMAEAEVGDDVYGDDPTVNALEEKAAELFGKESALFVTSGTQGNLVSVLSQTGRGDEIILGNQSHIYSSEAGGVSVLGGVVMYPLETNQNGTIDIQKIKDAVKGDDYHKPRTKLFSFENSHNWSSGRPINKLDSDKMAKAAKEVGLRVHVDGARIFNSAVSLGIPVKELTENVDSVTFCLSKGLGCPIGSVIVGEKDQIIEARRVRKILGSAMRQVGVIASCGIVALDTMIERLEDDHENAKKLAIGLSEMDIIEVDADNIYTNLVRFKITNQKGFEFAEKLKEFGVHINGGESDLRMVTHYGIESSDIDKTIEAVSKAVNVI